MNINLIGQSKIILIILFLFEFNYNACSMQQASKKDSIRNIIIEETTDFINKMKQENPARRVWVLKIIELDTAKSTYIFSISYIFNKLDLKSLNVSKYFEIGDEIILVDINHQTESGNLGFKEINKGITTKFLKRLRSFWDENYGYVLYTADYRVVVYKNGILEVKNLIETSVPDTLKIESDSAIQGYNNFMQQHIQILNDSTIDEAMPDFLKQKKD